MLRKRLFVLIGLMVLAAALVLIVALTKKSEEPQDVDVQEETQADPVVEIKQEGLIPATE